MRVVGSKLRAIGGVVSPSENVTDKATVELNVPFRPRDPESARLASIARSHISVVHLGNLGYRMERRSHGILTRQDALCHPDWAFFGIDAVPLGGERPKNWTQIKGDFISGLSQLPENSIDRIKSSFAVGYYKLSGSQAVQKEYPLRPTDRIHTHTLAVVELSYRKLRDGGKLVLEVGEKACDVVQAALLRSSFQTFHKETLDPNQKNGEHAPYWVTFWRDCNREVFRISARKKPKSNNEASPIATS